MVSDQIAAAQPAMLTISQFLSDATDAATLRSLSRSCLASAPPVRALSLCAPTSTDEEAALHRGAVACEPQGALVVVRSKCDTLGRLPAGVAEELRWLHATVLCPSSLPVALPQLVTLRVRLESDLAHATLLVDMVRDCESLRTLDVVAQGGTFGLKDCCALVQHLGPQVRTLRLWNHLATDHAFRIDRTSAVAAVLARRRPDLLETADLHTSAGWDNPLTYLVTDQAQYPIAIDAGGCAPQRCRCRSLSRRQLLRDYCHAAGLPPHD